MNWCRWCGEPDDGAHDECRMALRDLFEARAEAADDLAHLDEMAGFSGVAASHRDRAARLRDVAGKFVSVSPLTLAFGTRLL